MGKLILICVIGCTMLCSVGCEPNRVVIVHERDAVRLAQDVNSYVYAKNAAGEWVKSNNKVKLEEGQYVVTLDPAGK
jgi:hypothetical protein